MKFNPTTLPGVFEVQIDALADDRGFFARTWCRDEFSKHGLNPNVLQCSISFNRSKATLRGMHYQVAPFEETKVVRCTKGAIFDVAVDLRPDSPTFKKSFGLELSAENRNALYIPFGCAHGFVTLEDETEIYYTMSQVYDANSARGVRWNDPAFGIIWPKQPAIMTDRDRNYPDFKE